MKKQANIGRLPDQMNANVSMVNGLRQQHESLSLQLRTEQDRLSMVEGQLEQMKQGAGGAGMTSTGAAGDPGGADAHHRPGASAAPVPGERLHRTAPGHHRHEGRAGGGAPRAHLGRASRARATAPTWWQPTRRYRQKIIERDAARLRITTLQRQIGQALAQIGSYQARVDSAPLVEQELSSLVQDESLERKRYEDLSSQYQKAQVAEDVTRKQGGERFVVLNLASLPTRPTSPDLLQTDGHGHRPRLHARRRRRHRPRIPRPLGPRRARACRTSSRCRCLERFRGFMLSDRGVAGSRARDSGFGIRIGISDRD